MSDPTVPVHCECGWTGRRRPEMVKARPCPACDGEVRRWRNLERGEKKVDEIRKRTIETMVDQIRHKARDDRRQLDIEAVIAEKNEPVPRLPNPYYLRTVTGEVHIFRIPPHLVRRGARRRRR